MPSTSTTTCVDCGITTPNLHTLRKRHLCHACSTRFIASKITKRMESYRFRNQVGDHRRKLLLPLSGGTSTAVLLHVLDRQLKKQLELQNRSAYDLILVHVRLDERDESVEKWRDSIMEKFHDHQFLELYELPDVMRCDPNIEEDLKQLGLVRNDSEDDVAFITRLFLSTKSASAKSDLQELLLLRLLITLARSHNCESILWGHSDSRLAAKALADVAKGRGGAVSNTLADGLSPWGINFNYPVRDLYKTELQLYTEIESDALAGCILKREDVATAPLSIRNTSIDALLTGYITSQGEKYPSIMANVVRTASKLQTPVISETQKCKLCSMSISTGQNENNLCYGCMRMKQDIKP